MQTIRTPLSVFLAAIVTITLFFVMNYLVQYDKEGIQSLSPGVAIQFGPVKLPPEKPPETLPDIVKKPVKQPPPTSLEPVMEDMASQIDAMPDIQSINLSIAGIGVGVGNFNPSGLSGDGEIMPKVMMPPRYPQKALLAGLEGYVKVLFTITETGNVADIKILESVPVNTFDQEVIRALMKWKFNPKMVNGSPVSQQAIKTFDFNLDQET